jgi:hypothetical protein
MTQADITPYAPKSAPVFTNTPSMNALVTTGLDGNGTAQIRMEYGNFGVILRNDGTNFYILFTLSGNPGGTWNTALLPLTINMTTGAVTIDGTGVGSSFGAAPTFPTRAPGDNTLSAANTSFVQAAINALTSFIASTYAPAASPTFSGAVNITGTAVLGAPPPNDSSVRVPNTAWVQSLLTAYAQLAGANFTGAVSVPSPAPTDNSARVPNTNWVLAALAAYAPLSAFNPQVLSSNGYMHLPGGLLAQWGSNAISGVGQAISFQIPFPNSVFFVQSTDQGSGGTTSLHTTSCPVLSLSQFKAFANDHTGTPATTNLTWFALGI